MTTEQKDLKVGMNNIISDLLKYGVIASTFLIAAGVLLTFLHPSNSFPGSLQQLVSANYGKPSGGFGGLLSGLASGAPSSILQLGLIVLLATPVARVLASVILFGVERDAKYVAITLFVLAVLLVSTFLIGPAEAASSH
jgi:uncharacterized membrane protein